MTHYYDSPCGKYKWPSPTGIISDATPKDWGPQWGANQAVEWIRKNCAPYAYTVGNDDVVAARMIKDEDFDSARFAYKETSQTALDVGSEVHNLIEHYLLDDIVLLDYCSEQAESAFNAFRDFEKEHDLKPIALERTVYGDCWAGTLDFLGYFDGKLYVIDWKSSKDFYWDSMGPQIAAYKSVTNAEGCGILRLDKDSGMPFYRDRTKYYERDLAIFNAMKQLYFLRHPKIAKGAGWKNT